MDSKVLVVDDEERSAHSVKRLLELDGLKVTTCSSGDEAIKTLQTQEFDVILLDIMMPGAPPKKVVETIREKGVKTKIFYFSALKQGDESSQKLLAGLVSKDDDDLISGYIEKPFDPDQLVEKIKKALKG